MENPDDPRRTRSDFQREGIALPCPDYLMSKYWYLMISSDPNSHYHALKDLRWQAAMDEEMNSLQKKYYLGTSFSSSGEEIGSTQVGVLE